MQGDELICPQRHGPLRDFSPKALLLLALSETDPTTTLSFTKY